MSDVTINIHGGNNQILPNATEAVQNFYGVQSAGTDQPSATGTVDGLSDADPLAIYVNKEHISGYISQIAGCRSAAELGMFVVGMQEKEPDLTKDEIVKGRFIRLLLPHVRMFTNGLTVDNIRKHINEALSRRPRRLP